MINDAKQVTSDIIVALTRLIYTITFAGVLLVIGYAIWTHQAVVEGPKLVTIDGSDRHFACVCGVTVRSENQDRYSVHFWELNVG